MKIKNKKRNIGIIIFRIISIIIIIICLIVLFLWQKDNNSNADLQNDLTGFISEKNLNDEQNSDESANSENPGDEDTSANSTPSGNSALDRIIEELSSSDYINDLAVNFEALSSRNPDTVAWVKLNNTNINFPVVQTTNNSYYLTRNFDKKRNSAGWIFADYRNNFETLDTNTIVYGHNRRNGTMFSNLTKFLNSNWYSNEGNKYFNFITKNQNYIAAIFSVYKVSANNISLTNNFSSQEELEQNIQAWKSASVYNFNIDISTNDYILTLCTCDNTSAYRIVIISKLIPIN